MKQVVHFTKMHGAGNDYIYVDSSLYNIDDPNNLAIKWSDRHKGIGSDGLVLIEPSLKPEADFSMRIFNADGSEALMCGNACRCIGKYLYENKMTNEQVIRLITLSGVKILKLSIGENEIVKSVTVDMGEPSFVQNNQFVPLKGVLPQGTFVSMGNPHYVIFVNNINDYDVWSEGKKLEYSAAFPERANIEFAELHPDGIRVRVWERGSGITMACGTGACATAVAACKTGRASRKNRIIMDGGTLDIEWNESDGHVYLTGPAEFVFEGDAEI